MLKIVFKNFFRPIFQAYLKHLDRLTFVCLTLIYRISGYRFLFIDSERIGHFCLSEASLRESDELKSKKHPKIIGIYRRKVANDFLLKMFKRKIFCFRSNYLESFLEKMAADSPPFLKKRINTGANFTAYQAFSPALKFTEEEIQYGKQKLLEMGITANDWFVCFHMRDETYLKNQFPNQDWGRHQYRNSALEDLRPSMEYITQLGGFALRMGQITETRLLSENKKIIDYANTFRSDFLDIFLLSQCRFFIGTTSGVTNLAIIFNRPYMLYNLFPLIYIKAMSTDLFLPLKLRNKQQVLLKFETMKKNNYFLLSTQEEFDQHDLEVVQNSAEEILEATKEFYEIISNKKNNYSNEVSERLFEKFCRIFDVENKKIHGQISRSFLLTNQKELF